MAVRSLALLLLLFLTPPAAAAPADARIDALVAAFMKKEQVPGVAVVALKGHRAVLRRAWGRSRIDGVQPYYSIGKQMTAALILKLAERGKVDVEAPVARYLPEWFSDEPALKVRHLLRQTSGLAEFTHLEEAARIGARPPGTGSLADMLPIVDRRPRRFLPGERHGYSNSNYTALALIAERAGGSGFDALQRRLLFEPLGLRIRSCAGIAPASLTPGSNPGGEPAALPRNTHPAYDGNGGNCGTADDLARWTRALGTGGVVQSPLLESMRRGVPVRAGYTPPYGFGLSTKAILGRRALWHAGTDDGWGAFAAYLPDEDLTLVLLFSRGWLWSTDLALPLLRELLEEAPRRPLERRPLLPEERAALTGAFEDGLFDIGLAADSDRLLVSIEPFGPPIVLWKQPGGTFVSPDRPDTFSLRLAPAGPELDWAEHRSYLVRR